MPRTVRVDIFSDVICPWCLIGWERLKRAAALLAGEIALDVHWLPFELNPQMPPEGVERSAYLQRKFGTARPDFVDRIETLVRDEGIAIDFARIAVTPSTFAAHRLLHWAETQGRATALKEALFRAYFAEGRNIGEAPVLRDAVAAAGLDAAAAEAVLTGDQEGEAVRALEAEAQRLGIRGVPFFIIDRRLAVSGAQSPAVLADALREAARMAA